MTLMHEQMSDSLLKSWPVRLLIICGVFSLTVGIYSAIQVSKRSAIPAFLGTEYPDTPVAPDFTLTDHEGAERKLSDFSGSTVLLFFGFTNCPDVCPLTLASLARVIEAEGLSAEDVRVLLVTVDPENDTPDRMKEYVGYFGPAVTGLTGSPEQIQSVQADYGIYARHVEGHDGEPTMAHTTQVFGIDRAGKLRVLIHAEDGDDVVRNDLLELIRVGEEQG